MRITTFLLLAICLHVSARSDGQRITLKDSNVPLDKAFSQIEAQTGYSFAYTGTQLSRAHPVTIEIVNGTLDQVLTVCFQDQPFTYSIVGKTIVVQPRPELPAEPEAPAPPVDVHGRIIDSLGNPLAGATIVVKGSVRGTQSDDNGYFSLKEIAKSAILHITFTGYETQDVRVDGKSEIVISLRRGVTSLVDVVINKGYYSESQRLSTADVSTVKSEVIQEQPVTDPLGALQGRVPGLYINTTGPGLPGTSFTVRLMGRNSISNGNDPLYIVDGVPFASTNLNSSFLSYGGSGLSPLNTLNTSDIESIEVLKDADGTAIYGSRGANGVILITTKKGKAGKTRLDINIGRGANSEATKVHLLNTKQYLQMRHQAFQNDGVTPTASDYDINGTWDTTRYTDWQKIILGNSADFTNAQVSLTGGNANTQFELGGGLTNQGAILPGNFRDQKESAHLSLTHNADDHKLQISSSISFVNDNNLLPSSDMTPAILLPPDAPPVYDANGNLNWANGTWQNPFAALTPTVRANTDNLIGNVNFSYELLPGLRISANVGGNYVQSIQTRLIPITSVDPAVATNETRKSFYTNVNSKSWNAEPQINYTRSLGRSKIDLLAGSTFQENASNASSITGYNFTSDALIGDYAAAASYTDISYSKTLYHYSGGFARLGYNYDGKYILNLTGRRDGSSRFGPDRQFGNFGSVGVGWIFSKENWLENNAPFLSLGKIRASYGTAGNDQISDYQYLSSYSPYYIPYQNVAGLFPIGLANPYFGWELDKKLNVGIDLGFIKDRILFAGAYYRNRTANQLVGYSLPTITGFSSVEANLPAVIQNTGFELSLNTINIQSKDLKWTSTFNLTSPRNKLVAYPNLAGSSYANFYTVGKPLFVQKLYHYTGLDASTGLYTFEDVNKDGQITYPQDILPEKSVTQRFFGGFGNTLNYKGFQLDVFFQFVKQTGLNYLSSFTVPGLFNIQNNQPTYILNNSSIEKFTRTASGALSKAFSLYRNSDAKIQDASFARLKNIALSYQFPAAWVQKAHLKNLKLYLQCQNLLTITKYKGIDPENQGYIPPTRTVLGGIAIGL